MADEDLTLRDKFAIEILNGMLSSPTVASSLHESKFDHKYYLKEVEELVRSCYQIADIMRRVRLTVFE